jgi:putative cell wall-binding protein
VVDEESLSEEKEMEGTLCQTVVTSRTEGLYETCHGRFSLQLMRYLQQGCCRLQQRNPDLKWKNRTAEETGRQIVDRE